MKSIFISHGGPPSILKEEDKATADYWRALGNQFSGVAAIVCVSAHWYSNNTSVSINTANKIIHDFGEFFKGIYDYTYAFQAPSESQITAVKEALQAYKFSVSNSTRGLDHGIWIPMESGKLCVAYARRRTFYS